MSGTHANPLGIKTDAPWSVVWDIMRCWVGEHPVKTPAPGSAGVCVRVCVRVWVWVGCGGGLVRWRWRWRRLQRLQACKAMPAARPRIGAVPGCAAPLSPLACWAPPRTSCHHAPHPSLRRPPRLACAAEKILAKEPEVKADFSRAQQAVSKAKQKGVARFLPNPGLSRGAFFVGCGAPLLTPLACLAPAAEANWGPKPRHGRPAKQQRYEDGLKQQPQPQPQQGEQQQEQEEQAAALRTEAAAPEAAGEAEGLPDQQADGGPAAAENPASGSATKVDPAADGQLEAEKAQ